MVKTCLPLIKEHLHKFIGKTIAVIACSSSGNTCYLSNYYSVNPNKFSWVLTESSKSLFVWPSTYNLLESLDVEMLPNAKIWIEIQ